MFKRLKQIFSKTSSLLTDYEDVVINNNTADINKIIENKKKREVKFVDKVNFEELGGEKPNFKPEFSEDEEDEVESVNEIQQIPVKKTDGERKSEKLSMAEYYKQKYEERINK